MKHSEAMPYQRWTCTLRWNYNKRIIVTSQTLAKDSCWLGVREVLTVDHVNMSTASVLLLRQASWDFGFRR